jgi:hypothetical protein
MNGRARLGRERGSERGEQSDPEVHALGLGGLPQVSVAGAIGAFRGLETAGDVGRNRSDVDEGGLGAADHQHEKCVEKA